MATNSQMYNLTTLIKRLEAATSRLEDLAAIPSGPSSTITAPAPVANQTSVPGFGAPSIVNHAAVTQPTPPSLADFDALIANEVGKFLKLSEEIGGLVAEQSKGVQRCFKEQRRFLEITTKAKKPSASSDVFMELVTGMQKEVSAVGEIRENNRPSPFINHLSTVNEGIPALAWVMTPEPLEHIKAAFEGSQYFGNKVLNEYRNKDKKNVEWAQSFYSIHKALQEYVKKHHKTGVTWNANGVDAKEVMAIASPALAAFSGASPPPPPPGPPPQLDSTAAPAGGIDAVFAEINQGSGITTRLKKVDKSEMTHKNPSLRVSSEVPGSAAARSKSPAPPPRTKPATLRQKSPPKKELDGNKWYVENYEGHNLTLEISEKAQSIFISRCKDTSIQIQGKCNSICLTECEKTNLVAESLVSGIEIIKSKKFAIQVTHKLPTVQIDGCDGGIIYISKESKDVEVFTSKSTSINICVPSDSDDSEFLENAVPEQMKHRLNEKGLLVSEIVEHFS